MENSPYRDRIQRHRRTTIPPPPTSTTPLVPPAAATPASRPPPPNASPLPEDQDPSITEEDHVAAAAQVTKDEVADGSGDLGHRGV